MIKTHDLTKAYGDHFALRDLTLELNEGDLFGYIGPNGSGKTTTMRILATLLQPTWGEASVCGYSIYTQPKEIRRLIGFMPDFFGVYDDMKVIEYLEFFAAAYRIKGHARQKICNEVLDLVNLAFKREALVTGLSRGQTQRLGLARVLMHDPKVLILDEPASGLDPRARIDFRNLLMELRKTGKTIIVSSHILPELSDVCNKVGMIEHGKMIFSGDMAELMRLVRPRTVLQVGVEGDLDAAGKASGAEQARGENRCQLEPLVGHALRRRGRLQRTARAIGPIRPPADALQGGRDQPGNGVHGADEGDYGVRPD